MNLKTGDKVKLLLEKGEGIVVEVINSTKVLVAIDGFELPYPIHELVKVNTTIEYIITPSVLTKKKAASGTPKKLSKKKKSENLLEIDLHIYELLDNTHGMSNGEIIQFQLNKVIQVIDKAYQKKIRKIIIIHGVGEGVLKREVRTLLNSYENIEYQDASYAKYGFGATEVLLF